MITSSNSNITFSANVPPEAYYRHSEPDLQTQRFNVLIEVAINDKGALASGVVKIDDDEFVAAASTKRRNGDRRNDELGVKLAVSRVLEKIQRKIEKQAQGLIKHEVDRQNGVF